jgi:hypothetical protein
MSKFKLPKPPFFKPGSLVFLGSGHNLIKDGKYYRCGRDTNQICQFEDRRVGAEALEKKFSRLAKTLHGQYLDPDELIEKLMRENLCDLIFGSEKKSKGSTELVEATAQAVAQEVASGGKVKKKDEKDFLKSKVDELKADHSILLFGYAISMMRFFAVKDISDTEAGRTFAHYAKKIYVTDKGTIHSVELERWAWYCFNVVIEKNWPGILTKNKNLKITNGPDKLQEKNLVEAALEFGTDDFPEAMGEQFVGPMIMMKLMKDSMNVSLKGDMTKMNESTSELINQFTHNPLVGILFGITTLTGLKK